MTRLLAAILTLLLGATPTAYAQGEPPACAVGMQVKIGEHTDTILAFDAQKGSYQLRLADGRTFWQSGGTLENMRVCKPTPAARQATMADLAGKWAVGPVRASAARFSYSKKPPYNGPETIDGALTIGADGTYSWAATSGTTAGRWRAYNDGERIFHGAQPGIILLQAFAGADWRMAWSTTVSTDNETLAGLEAGAVDIHVLARRP